MAEAPDFSIDVERTGDCVLLALAGELDLASRDVFSAAVGEALQSNPAAITLDFGKVEFLDSSGIGGLMQAWASCSEVDVRMTILNPTPLIVRTLSIVGLLDMFGIDAPDD